MEAGGGDLVRVGRLQVLQRHRGLQVAQHLARAGGGVRRGRGGGGGHREGGREVRGLEVRHGGHHAAAGHRGQRGQPVLQHRNISIGMMGNICPTRVMLTSFMPLVPELRPC